MCLCHLIIFSFKGQAAAWVLLFWVLEHRFTALLGGMDALLTMNWNFVCTGVATHRLHCQLLSLRDTAEAFMGHRMKLRSPLNEDSVQTVALYRSLLSSCVLIPGSVLRIFLKCSWTAHTHFSTVRQINKTDELFSPLSWPVIGCEWSIPLGSQVFINRQGQAQSSAIWQQYGCAGVIQTED